MRTIKMILFAIFILLLADKVATLSFIYELSHSIYIVTKTIGVMGASVVAALAIIQN